MEKLSKRNATNLEEGRETIANTEEKNMCTTY
jgi:hypothetical protein